jgi:ribosomal protein S18 acetylase RimI-like enzyme
MLPAEDQFDSVFHHRCEFAVIRSETHDDAEFLVLLFIACAPLAAVLPEPMLRQQASIQKAGHIAEFPSAMRRIILLNGLPVARFMIDWNSTRSSHAVDLAVLPQARRSGIGLQLLRTWIEVADALHKPCTLEVLADNPARKIYDRLGFIATRPVDPNDPVIIMERPFEPNSPS